MIGSLAAMKTTRPPYKIFALTQPSVMARNPSQTFKEPSSKLPDTEETPGNHEHQAKRHQLNFPTGLCRHPRLQPVKLEPAFVSSRESHPGRLFQRAPIASFGNVKLSYPVWQMSVQECCGPSTSD